MAKAMILKNSVPMVFKSRDLGNFISYLYYNPYLFIYSSQGTPNVLIIYINC